MALLVEVQMIIQRTIQQIFPQNQNGKKAHTLQYATTKKCSKLEHTNICLNIPQTEVF